ncbi:MAG: ATP-binding protein [Candidatus Tectomicrobia bacterium]
MYSIRGRLTLLLVLGLGLLLLVSGGLFDTVIRAQLVREFDRALLAKAKALMTLTKDYGTEVELDFADEMMPEFGTTADQPEYFAIWLPSGELLEKSYSLGSHHLPRRPTLTNEPLFRDLVLPNGLAGRLVEVAFVPQIEDDDTDDDSKDDETNKADMVFLDPTHYPDRAAVLLMARDRQALDAFLRTLRLALVIAVGGLLAVMVGMVRVSLRVGLRPLDEVRQQVAHLDARSLTRGVQVQTQSSELAPVIEQLNALLRRLDAAFVREREFSRDVAHELRTPLAELRTLTEVGIRWPHDVDAVTQYLTDAHAISLHMERIVVSLLTLARCESGTQQVRPQPINVRELLHASWAIVARLAQEKALTFQCEMPSTCSVASDPDMLLTVVSNLVSNAVTYSPPQKAIHCVAAVHGGTMRLTIRNSTEGLTPEDIPHIFERFWRKDPARTAGDHTGLGLAIVKVLSELLDLSVHATLDQENNFAITISLSCAPSG